MSLLKGPLREATRALVGPQIDRLSTIAVNTLSQRDWELDKTPEARELKHHIASDWSLRDKERTEPIVFKEQVMTSPSVQFLAENPQVYWEVQDVSTDFDDSLTQAKTLLHIHIKRKGSDVVMSGYAQFLWRLEGGKWVWYDHFTMRGVSTV